MTIMNKKKLPVQYKINPRDKPTIKGVTGHKIDIVGRATDVPAVIQDTQIKMNPYITDSNILKDVIVGADTINRYPEVLMKIMEENRGDKKALKTVPYNTAYNAVKTNKITEQLSPNLTEEIKTKYSSLFSTVGDSDRKHTHLQRPTLRGRSPVDGPVQVVCDLQRHE